MASAVLEFWGIEKVYVENTPLSANRIKGIIRRIQVGVNGSETGKTSKSSFYLIVVMAEYYVSDSYGWNWFMTVSDPRQ